MRRLVLPLLASLLVLSPLARAEVVDNLYQVREPVTSQQTDERNAALKRALQVLAGRLTGNPQAGQTPGLASALAAPESLISQYSYDAGPPEVLVANFDPAATERALGQAGLSVWGANRPVVMIWWLNDADSGATLVGDGQPASTGVQRGAQRAGLPIRLPLADLNEQLAGTAANIDASDPTALRQASERYGANALLAVHAKPQGNGWQAQWRLWNGSAAEQGSSQAADQEALAAAVLQDVAARLSKKFVSRPGTTQPLTLVADNSNFERYAQLQKVLEPLSSRLVKVEGTQLIYNLTANPDQLQAQLGLAGLQPASAPAATAAPATPAAATPGAPVDATATPSAPVAQPASSAQPARTTLYFRWP
ncbi:DUF2066 domain-containing protein [Pseudomonas oryzihabitans]|uniref:DUF2066 domain-containing protein n=1 Tax=Pseudomonas oryzihabitans TaxID=47885 RepID=A0A2Z5A6A3_9PSED|nr:DUF2066 domain-containing protein [Pseudomonas oryzihabitans]AXA66147.1 hypothetical protein CE139_10035 [Pseudomonas oryzihabitans]